MLPAASSCFQLLPGSMPADAPSALWTQLGQIVSKSSSTNITATIFNINACCGVDLLHWFFWCWEGDVLGVLGLGRRDRGCQWQRGFGLQLGVVCLLALKTLAKQSRCRVFYDINADFQQHNIRKSARIIDLPRKDTKMTQGHELQGLNSTWNCPFASPDVLQPSQAQGVIFRQGVCRVVSQHVAQPRCVGGPRARRAPSRGPATELRFRGLSFQM